MVLVSSDLLLFDVYSGSSFLHSRKSSLSLYRINGCTIGICQCDLLIVVIIIFRVVFHSLSAKHSA